MLDTDISSYVIRGAFPQIDIQLRKLSPAEVCISVVTRAELVFGLRRLHPALRLTSSVERFLAGIRSLPWDEVAADHYADVRAYLERIGKPIGEMDTMIAAHARALKATLVTNNLKHFQQVKNLRIENWT